MTTKKTVLAKKRTLTLAICAIREVDGCLTPAAGFDSSPFAVRDARSLSPHAARRFTLWHRLCVNPPRHRSRSGLRRERIALASPWPLVDFTENIMGTILLIILILLLLGAAPAWPYSRNWGYYPSGALGTIFLIVLILVLLQRI